MRNRTWLKVLYRIAPVLLFAFTAIGVIIVVLNNLSEPDGSQGPLGKMVQFVAAVVKSHSHWLQPANAGALVIIGYLLKFRSQDRLDQIIKRLLDKFRDSAFPESDAYVTHRVTLFKYKKWHFGGWTFPVVRDALNFRKKDAGRWPWHGWLVAYERSGEFSLNSGTYFYAPKNNVDLADGFAGYLFRTRLAVYWDDLPLINGKSSIEQIQEYCDRSRVSEQFVRRKIRQKRALATSFWGTYVDVDNKNWGVLVVDSRTAKLPRTLPTTFAPTASCLSHLLSSRAT